MKISNQIIIVVIIIALAFFIKSDYKSVYSKTYSYLQNEIGKYSSILKNKTINNNSNTDSSDIGTFKVKSVETPGALVVADNFITNSIDRIKLSNKDVIDITNRYRKENGNLTLLKENSKLDFSAEKKLQDMFAKQYFEHISPSGVGVGDLGNQVSYEYIIIGENLALGNFKDKKSLVDAWMASPGHRANILNKKYTEIGVSVGRGTYNGKSVWMAVQHFGLPKSACPSIGVALHEVIILEQKKAKEMESDLSLRKSKIDNGVVLDSFGVNSQINDYNSMVNDYNKLILDIKEKINEYNSQVRDFNSCIENFS